MVSTMFPLLAKQFEHQRTSNPPLLDLILQSLNVNNESLWFNIYYYNNIDGGIQLFSGFLLEILPVISHPHIKRVIVVTELSQEIRFSPISTLLNRTGEVGGGWWDISNNRK